MQPHSQIMSVQAVKLAARQPKVIEAMEALYRELDNEIAAQAPTCWNKGECCRFGEYGHRLFVTTLEMAYYLATKPDQVPHEDLASARRRLPIFEPTDPLTSDA